MSQITQNDPYTSVIVPIANEPAADLIRHLTSLKLASADLIECIIVSPSAPLAEDGTVLDAQAIRKKFGFRRVEIISGQDVSHRDAIRIGALAATGAVLTWLNIDDVIQPGAIETVLAAHADDPNAILYGNSEQISEGASLGPYPVMRDINEELLGIGCFISQPACWIPLKVWTALGGLRNAYALGFDHELWLRAARKGVNFRFIDKTLASIEVRRDARSFTHRAEVLAEHGQLQLEYFGRCAPSVLTSLWAETLNPAFGYDSIPEFVVKRAPALLADINRVAQKRGDQATVRRLIEDMRLWFLVQGVSAEIQADGSLSDAARISFMTDRPPPKIVVSIENAAINQRNVALIDADTGLPCRTASLPHANSVVFLPDSGDHTAGTLRRFNFIAAEDCNARLEAMI